MKKFRLLTIIASLLFVMAVSVSAENPIKVVVGGEQIKTDVAPVIVNDRTLVPLRAIFEALDATVDWDGATQTVIATKDDTAISLQIGNDKMFVNGTEVTLDVPAQLIEDRTMVPIRAISESFGNEVLWNNVTRTVRVKKGVWLETKWYYSYGTWTKYTYDENGNLVYWEESSGYWAKYTYDENGIRRSQEDSLGVTGEYTYDENWNLICVEYSNGTWTKYTYDENGNQIYVENSHGAWLKYTYDENGNLIYAEHPDGVWTKYTYDENGNRIYVELSNGNRTKYTYNENGNLIYGEDSYGYWFKCSYDENGNEIYTEYSDRRTTQIYYEYFVI